MVCGDECFEIGSATFAVRARQHSNWEAKVWIAEIVSCAERVVTATPLIEHLKVCDLNIILNPHGICRVVSQI